ncbi:hypothetical protein ABT034_31000, partial [Streptomyces sp. NPDC002773]
MQPPPPPPPPPPSYPYAYAPPPPPARRWWQHSALIIVLLVFFPPAGIALVWLSRWGQTKKIVATVLAGVWFLLFLSGSRRRTPNDQGPRTDSVQRDGRVPRIGPR